jgi:hypothetical protein
MWVHVTLDKVRGHLINWTSHQSAYFFKVDFREKSGNGFYDPEMYINDVGMLEKNRN